MIFIGSRRVGALTAAGCRGTHRLTASLAAGLLAHSNVSAQAPTRAATAAAISRAGDAVVTIIAYHEGTSDFTNGTGVRVSDGRVVTALRHLRGAVRVVVFGADGDSLGTLSTLDQAEVKLDLAVLPRTLETSPTITLARRPAALAQKVSVLGPKKGTTRPVMERSITHMEPDDTGRPLLRLGAPLVGSSVGAPVVNSRGELVAIALGSIPGRQEGDVAVDVSAIRELLTRPAVRLGFPSRDGSLAAARAPTADPKTVGTAPAVASKPAEPTARPHSTASIFPERYGAPVSADTAGSFEILLYGCAKLESRKRIYCYLRVGNLASGRTLTIAGGDLADSTHRKVREAENLVQGDSAQRIAGWRNKATIPLRELESVRVAVEFEPPAKDSDAVFLILDIGGERTLSLGPFILLRAP